jgi:hypothetical protein
MKPLRLIPILFAALAFVFVQALPVQAEKAAETAGQAAKKAGKKVKDTAEQTGEKTGKAVHSATEPATTPETQMSKKAKAATAGSANRATPTVSESEIAAAKAAGKVWVNTETRVYHKSGKWYGATKQGKFMTEDDAIKAGYRAAKSR